MKSTLKYWFETIGLLRFFLAFLFYAGSLVAGITFIMVPQGEAYNNSVTLKMDLDNTYLNLQDLDVESAEEAIRTSIEDLSTIKQQFEERLFTGSNINRVLPDIDKMCSQLSLSVTRLEPLDLNIPYESSYTKNHIGLSVKGQFSNFLKLLGGFETYKNWIVIDEFSIQPIPKSRETQFDLTLSIISKGVSA